MKIRFFIKFGQSLVMLALIGHSIPSFASDPMGPFCNASRSGRIEGDQKKCYVYSRKLIREATGHDYNLDEAKGSLDTMLKVNPDSVYSRIGSAELYLKERELNLQTDSFNQIYQEARIATKITPVISDSYVTLGMLDLMVNCIACAELDAKKAKALGNTSPELAVLISSIAENNNDLPKAIAELTKTLSLTTPLATDVKVDILIKLSRLKAKQKNYIGAEMALNEAIAANPSNPNAYLAKSELLLFWKGDSAAAVNSAIAANKVMTTVEGKRIQAISEYLVWANDYLSGRKTIDIKRIAQISIITPEEAFVFSARYIGTSKIAEALLKAKILNNIEVQDGQGNTALITASIGNNINFAKILVGKKANINAQNSSGQRALSFWISNKNYDAVSMLLKAGAQINYTDINGNTPLSTAVFQQDRLLIDELINQGADIQPVLDLAKEFGITDIKKVINDHHQTVI